MILSVSRRTDIPAFYSEWFFNRLEEGFCYIQNPMNAKQVQKVLINPQLVDAIVFWTKNPRPMLTHLHKLKEYPFYFQYTVNSYADDIESRVSQKKYIVESFKALSSEIGKERVIWRYDPILLNKKYTIDYHIKYFEVLTKELSSYTEKVIISFIDFYKKISTNWKNYGIHLIEENEKHILAKALGDIARSYNLQIESCCEDIDLAQYTINHARCIDDSLLSKIGECSFILSKDKGQRLKCGCVQSVDIGIYNTCLHACRYCYASFSDLSVEKNIAKHNPNNPLLVGEVPHNVVVKDKKQKSVRIPCFRAASTSIETALRK